MTVVTAFFTSKYSGICINCGDPYGEGTRIRRVIGGAPEEDGYACCEGEPPVLALQPGEKVCDSCHLVQPCFC